MLGGADLPPKFWPYAFHHWLCLYNVTVHRDSKASPFELCMGSQPDLCLLRVFGCHVYSLPACPCHPNKLVSDTCAGIFLGFSKMMKNILYYDIELEVVKLSQHVAFNKAMHDVDAPSLNARLLCGLAPDSPNVLDLCVSVPSLDVHPQPFLDLEHFVIPFDPDSLSPLGLHFALCSRLHRAYIHSVSWAPPGERLRAFHHHHVGSYVVSIGGSSIFSLADLKATVDHLLALSPAPPSVEIVLAPKHRSSFDDCPPPLHLRLQDLCRVCALQSVSGEGMTLTQYRSALDAFASDLSEPEMSMIIHCLQTADMTPDERNLRHMTRRNLQRLPNWPEWDAAFDAQLDAHVTAGTFGDPIPRPALVDGEPLNILHIQWSNLVKPDGTRKAWACINGLKHAAPWLHQFAQTYASCVEQPCQHLFFAVAVALGLVVTIGDTTNAFQQSPPPTQKCFLQIDDAVRSWYQKRHNKDIDPRTHVILLEHALQGHPEAGALWERMIVEILEGPELGFWSTTHERNLYQAR